MVNHKEFHKTLTKLIVEYEEAYNTMNTLLTIIVSFAIAYAFYVLSRYQSMKTDINIIIVSFLVFIFFEVILLGIFFWFRDKKKEIIKRINELS